LKIHLSIQFARFVTKEVRKQIFAPPPVGALSNPGGSMPEPPINTVRRALGWSAHLFTASGAFFGFLALLAVERGEIRLAFAWMGVTLLVDGVDGAYARWVGVQRVTPRFEGFIVDCIVDYFTYVILPVLILYRTDMLPEGWRLAVAALVLMSSTYHYGNLDVKAPDYFFYGFPAWWNVLVFYLYLLQTGAGWNLVVVLLFVVLTPVRLKYIHPFRVELLRPLNVVALAVWAVTLALMTYRYPEPSPSAAALSLAAVAWLGGLGVVQTFRGEAAGAGESTGGPTAEALETKP
jgi:phosphatidylcholine synthase